MTINIRFLNHIRISDKTGKINHFDFPNKELSTKKKRVNLPINPKLENSDINKNAKLNNPIKNGTQI